MQDALYIDRARVTESRTVDVWAEHYSPRNVQVLLAAGASDVAGYREWQAMGRQVWKGEHGIRLAAPVTVKDRETGERRMVNVRTVTVFDRSQTDPLVTSC